VDPYLNHTQSYNYLKVNKAIPKHPLHDITGPRTLNFHSYKVMDPKRMINELYINNARRDISQQFQNRWFAKRYTRIQILRYKMLNLKSKATGMFSTSDDRFLLQFNSSQVLFPAQCPSERTIDTNISVSISAGIWDRIKITCLSYFYGNTTQLYEKYERKLDRVLQCYELTLHHAQNNNANYTLVEATDGRY